MRILLIESDESRREYLTEALQAAGLGVLAVGRVSDVERWPNGDIVVTEFSRFSPWWKTIGALHVIVLADSEAEGADACERGASAWFPRDGSASGLVAAVREVLATPDPGCAETQPADRVSH
jgi:DNA-binding NarL/FixJ family response regulator